MVVLAIQDHDRLYFCVAATSFAVEFQWLAHPIGLAQVALFSPFPYARFVRDQ